MKLVNIVTENWVSAATTFPWAEEANQWKKQKVEATVWAVCMDTMYDRWRIDNDNPFNPVRLTDRKSDCAVEFSALKCPYFDPKINIRQRKNFKAWPLRPEVHGARLRSRTVNPQYIS